MCIVYYVFIYYVYKKYPMLSLEISITYYLLLKSLKYEIFICMHELKIIFIEYYNL
jgi:hypothetical protein